MPAESEQLKGAYFPDLVAGGWFVACMVGCHNESHGKKHAVAVSDIVGGS